VPKTAGIKLLNSYYMYTDFYTCCNKILSIGIDNCVSHKLSLFIDCAWRLQPKEEPIWRDRRAELTLWWVAWRHLWWPWWKEAGPVLPKPADQTGPVARGRLQSPWASEKLEGSLRDTATATVEPRQYWRGRCCI
jgi:hypothetical protein